MLEGGPLPWIVDTSGYYEEGETIFLYKLLHPKQIPVDSIMHLDSTNTLLEDTVYGLFQIAIFFHAILLLLTLLLPLIGD